MMALEPCPSVSPPSYLPVTKFSYATVANDSVAPIPWKHLNPITGLVAIFETLYCQNSDGTVQRQLKFKVTLGNETLEDIDLDTLSIATHRALALAQDRISHAQSLGAAVIVKRPLIAVRYIQADGQIRRFQIRLTTTESYGEAMALLARANVPTIEAGTFPSSKQDTSPTKRESDCSHVPTTIRPAQMPPSHAAPVFPYASSTPTICPPPAFVSSRILQESMNTRDGNALPAYQLSNPSQLPKSHQTVTNQASIREFQPQLEPPNPSYNTVSISPTGHFCNAHLPSSAPAAENVSSVYDLLPMRPISAPPQGWTHTYQPGTEVHPIGLAASDPIQESVKNVHQIDKSTTLSNSPSTENKIPKKVARTRKKNPTASQTSTKTTKKPQRTNARSRSTTAGRNREKKPQSLEKPEVQKLSPSRRSRSTRSSQKQSPVVLDDKSIQSSQMSKSKSLSTSVVEAAEATIDNVPMTLSEDLEKDMGQPHQAVTQLPKLQAQDPEVHLQKNSSYTAHDLHSDCRHQQQFRVSRDDRTVVSNAFYSDLRLLLADPAFAGSTDQLESWSELPQARRDAVLDTWFCQQFKNQDFIKLCETIERNWKRVLMLP